MGIHCPLSKRFCRWTGPLQLAAWWQKPQLQLEQELLYALYSPIVVSG